LPDCIGTSWFEAGNSCEINFYGSTIEEVDPKYYSHQGLKEKVLLEVPVLKTSLAVVSTEQDWKARDVPTPYSSS
jgi:hypothetical protein